MVHLAAALVGPPHPRVVRVSQGSKSRRPACGGAFTPSTRLVSRRAVRTESSDRAGESRNNVDVDAERNKERWIVGTEVKNKRHNKRKNSSTQNEDVPRFTPSTRIVSIRRGRGCFIFGF